MTTYATFRNGDVHVFDAGVDFPQLTIESKDGLRWSGLSRCAALEQLAVMSSQGYEIPNECFVAIRADLDQPMRSENVVMGVDWAAGESWSSETLHPIAG